MSIIIKNILLNKKVKDIYVEDNIIKEINDKISVEAEFKIDGRNKAAIPSFVNAHTHAAMTLLRGYADDKKLQDWWFNHIRPVEEKMTPDDMAVGVKLACLEMIKSGTTFFNDMYYSVPETIEAVDKMGIRALIGLTPLDASPQYQPKAIEETYHLAKQQISLLNHKRINLAISPHTIFTVCRENLHWAKNFADKHNLLIHIHLSETKKEVEDCINQHSKRPAEYLEEIDFLGANVIVCHSIWLNDKEIEILKKYDVKIVHNPVSNMKLASGVFPYEKLKNTGLTIALGTDGCASNNNLDMFESMKFASLLQKYHNNQPTVLPAKEAFEMATLNGANAFNLNAGVIEEGKIADLILINLKDVHLVPMHNLISNLVYSANSSCVDTTICDGKILMQNRIVKGEDKIKEEAQNVAEDLISRK